MEFGEKGWTTLAVIYAYTRPLFDIQSEIFLLPGAVPGETEDVYETLFVSAEGQEGEGIPVTFSFESITSLR